MLNRSPADHSSTANAPGSADCVERAQHVAPLVASAAQRIEQQREIPEDVLSALHEARLFRLLIPRSCDGEEVDPVTFFRVLETIAQADASTAWCVGQGCGVSMAAAYLEPEVARKIFGDPRAVAASGPSPRKAKAFAVDGGYRVTGSWGFASGSRHANWLGGHCIVCEPDGTPRPGPDGKPLAARTMLFPRSSATMSDVWQVVGLKGTGSDDYSVSDIFVPEDHSFTRESAAERREKGPLYRFSIFSMFGVAFAGVALGIARATLDEFIRLAGKKTPTSVTASPSLLRDNAVIQSQVGLAEARLQSGRALVTETFRDLWDVAAKIESFGIDQRLRMRMTTCYAIHQAKDVVDAVYHAAGATAIFEGNPFERRFRDIHTVTQQTQAHFSNFEVVGQSLLGLELEARV